jgi:hypothetical protein
MIAWWGNLAARILFKSLGRWVFVKESTFLRESGGICRVAAPDSIASQ